MPIYIALVGTTNKYINSGWCRHYPLVIRDNAREFLAGAGYEV